MPTAPGTRCLVPRCPNLAHRRGRCTDHYVPWEQPSTNERTLTRHERHQLRTEQLRREPNCRTCGATATECDHIRPISDGGAIYDPANLQSLCTACHDSKTRAENAARNKRRTQQTH